MATKKTTYNIRCSQCGEFVSEDGRDCTFVWGNDKDAPLNLVHKGKCDTNKEKYNLAMGLDSVFRSMNAKNPRPPIIPTMYKEHSDNIERLEKGGELMIKEGIKKAEAQGYVNIEWNYDAKYLMAYNYKKGRRSFYKIAKHECLTRSEQMDWLVHMSIKNWVEPYTFLKAFTEALKDWDLWKI